MSAIGDPVSSSDRWQAFARTDVDVLSSSGGGVDGAADDLRELLNFGDVAAAGGGGADGGRVAELESRVVELESRAVDLQAQLDEMRSALDKACANIRSLHSCMLSRSPSSSSSPLAAATRHPFVPLQEEAL